MAANSIPSADNVSTSRLLIGPHTLWIRRWLTAVTIALVVIIGLLDYLLGFEVSLLAFYFVPVALAVFARGAVFAVVIALCCTAGWIGGDIAAGAHYSSPFVPVWNAAIVLITFLVLIWLLAKLVQLQRHLEARVVERTAALANEVAERERLEREILEISERERRSIGHDLHDGLGQHLTGTAISGQVLAERLHERAAEEAPEAKKLVHLIEKGIQQTRQLAKGLLLADIDSDGLATALREFCAATSEQFRVSCVFETEGRIHLAENGSATHLYRIAQEAIRNAVRHGRAKSILVRLRADIHELVLTIADRGIGLPPIERRGAGLGLRIMRYRALIIGASFAIETPTDGGTTIVCKLPLPA